MLSAASRKWTDRCGNELIDSAKDGDDDHDSEYTYDPQVDLSLEADFSHAWMTVIPTLMVPIPAPIHTSVSLQKWTIFCLTSSPQEWMACPTDSWMTTMTNHQDRPHLRLWGGHHRRGATGECGERGTSAKEGDVNGTTVVYGERGTSENEGNDNRTTDAGRAADDTSDDRTHQRERDMRDPPATKMHTVRSITNISYS